MQIGAGDEKDERFDESYYLCKEIDMRWKVDHRKLFWILLVLTAGIVVINGMTTDVGLGDESHHYHFAQNIYEAGKRVAFDPMYKSGNPPGFFYNTPPLWHFMLAFLWKITGGISQTVAQAYHILFFVLLVWVVSLLAREISGEEGRWLSALIMTTVPMVVSFSTLFYMDIPMTAFSTLSFYLILKRNYIAGGVASGLMYLTKLNAGFFFPGFLFLILWNERRRFWSLFKNLAFFNIPILMIHIPDIYWRRQNISSQLDSVSMQSIFYRFSSGIQGGWGKEYLNSYLANPIDIVKYFGIAFLVLTTFYLFRYKQWNKKEAILWTPIISYIITFLITFGINSDIRYLIPILPFLIILCTTSILYFGKKWQWLIIGVCILQFISTTYYVHQKRQIPSDVKEGFEYIKKNVPENALILYPEENLLIYGQRRMIWSAVESYNKTMGGLDLIFWGSDYKQVGNLLQANQIDHILIKKSRIYDDSQGRHFGGYPRSFVERLSHLEGWTKIFENQEVSLWRSELQQK